nr:NTP transferase domain-containing protein [Rhodospirillales bacterium]
MKKHRTVAIVLAAGLGTRMSSTLPKVLHPLGGRPMLLQLFETLSNVLPDTTVLVTGPDMDPVSGMVANHKPKPNVVVQEERLGTGHAVTVARNFFEGNTGTVLVVYGDTPLLTVPTIQSLMSVRQSDENPAVVVLGFRPSETGEYGRLILDNNGSLQKI